MANTNLNDLLVGQVLANRVGAALGTTSNTAILTNSAASGKLYIVNAIYVSNIDGVNNADVSINLNTGTRYKIANLITVPAKATLVPVLKDAALHMLEGDILEAWASATGDLEILVMYLDLS